VTVIYPAGTRTRIERPPYALVVLHCRKYSTLDTKSALSAEVAKQQEQKTASVPAGKFRFRDFIPVTQLYETKGEISAHVNRTTSDSSPPISTYKREYKSASRLRFDLFLVRLEGRVRARTADCHDPQGMEEARTAVLLGYGEILVVH
jgi:hypothetical protein